MPRRVTKLEEDSRWAIQESSIDMPGHTLREIWAVCYISKPEKSSAAVADKTPSSGSSEYNAVLGDIKITTDVGNYSNFPPSNSWLVESEFVSWSSGSQGSKKLSVKIVWKLKIDDADVFPKYNIYVDKHTTSSLSENWGRVLEVDNEYLGAAVVKSFYVSELEVPSGTSVLKFVIQVCGLDGACQKLEESPFLELKVEGS